MAHVAALIDESLSYAAQIKEVWASIQVPNTNNSHVNVPSSAYQLLLSTLPELRTNSSNSVITLLIAIPSNLVEIVGLQFDFMPIAASGSGTISFSTAMIRGQSPKTAVAGGTLNILNPTYVGINTLLNQNMLSLLPYTLAADIAGGYLGGKMTISGMTGLNNRNFGLRMLYK